jgi:hypothetical protein
MPTHIALLRGITVGGRNRVRWPACVRSCWVLATPTSATYIQSGNVVFASEEADTAMIAAALERAIAEHLGVRPKVVVLTRAELARVVADNPFPEEPNLRWVHAIFRNGPSGPTSSPPWQPPSSEPATRQRPRGAGGRKHLVPAYPPVASAAASWPPNCSVSVVPELPSRLHSPQLGNLNKLLALCNP